MTHTPTPEQQAVIDAATSSSDNLIISALAGAAKTSTLVLLAEALPNTKILCLAFNKKIALEMTERLPANCSSQTLNSLGHRVWAEAIGKKLILKLGKTFDIVSELIKKLPKDEQKEAYRDFADTLKMIDNGKSVGYIPTGKFPNAKRLMDDEEFFASLDIEASPLQEQLIREATIISINQAFDGIIDFNDQILMPTVFPAMFPVFPLVMIDEAQDLSELNHATLKKLVKKRLIAVGDSNQAIYGFRGAHEDSMNLLMKTFNMTPLTLSVSFRCPRSIVAAVLWRAPHMKFPDWAIEGKVHSLFDWNAASIPETAAVICRNNAPLFSIAIKLLKNGRYPQLIGNDIGKYLVKTMKKFGKPDMEKPIVFTCIDEWAEAKRKKSRSKTKVDDQADCMRIFAAQGDTLGDALAYAEHLFSTQGPIQLMTGHKAKGLEFDNVFFLDQDLIKVEEGQEKNLKYVIQTRAKKELTYINSKDFADAGDDMADSQ